MSYLYKSSIYCYTLCVTARGARGIMRALRAPGLRGIMAEREAVQLLCARAWHNMAAARRENQASTQPRCLCCARSARIQETADAGRVFCDKRCQSHMHGVNQFFRLGMKRGAGVGVNRFEVEEEKTIPIQRIDPALEPKQIERLGALRAKRDAGPWKSALAGVEDAARSGGECHAANSGRGGSLRYCGRDFRRDAARVRRIQRGGCDLSSKSYLIEAIHRKVGVNPFDAR